MTDPNPYTPEELLDLLFKERSSFSDYADLERTLAELMRVHHDRLSTRVSAEDVLVYAADRGLVRRGDAGIVASPA